MLCVESYDLSAFKKKGKKNYLTQMNYAGKQSSAAAYQDTVVVYQVTDISVNLVNRTVNN